MKAPWFPFYTGDFLASPDVQLMEAHEVGAYLLLLAASWQSDTPGCLPDDEGRLRRVCRLSAEQWKESRALLLGKWPLDEAGQRYNPRLLSEAKKQVELREKKAEAGRLSAERRAATATQRQQSANTNPTGVEIPATGVGKKGNYSQPQPQSSYEDVAPPPASERLSETLPAQNPNPQAVAARASTDPNDEQPWSESPLTKPRPFQAICDDNGHAGIAYEFYRTLFLDMARNEAPPRPRTAPQWRSYVRKCLTHQLRDGPLRRLADLDLSRPTPRHEYPQPGQEAPGQLIVVGATGDASMDRMQVAAVVRHYPTANVQVSHRP